MGWEALLHMLSPPTLRARWGGRSLHSAEADTTLKAVFLKDNQEA